MKKLNLILLFLPFILMLQTHVAQAVSPAQIVLEDNVCTDDPTKAGKFGLRSCKDVTPIKTGVKTDAINALRSFVKTVIYAYYKGQLLDYDYNKKSDPATNQARPGFCRVVNGNHDPVPFVSPVCNIGDPNIPNSSGGKGELTKNWLGDQCNQASMQGQPAIPLPGSPQQEGYCRVDVDGDNNTSVDFRTCHIENSWISGMRVQLWQHFYKEVSDEIQSGTLLLHGVPGASPCGDSVGKALAALLNGDNSDPNSDYPKPGEGLKDTHKMVANAYKPTEVELATDETEGCVHAENQTGSYTDAQANQDAFTSNARGIAVEKKHISQAYCNVAYAHRYVEYLFNSLATCEVMERAKKSYYDHYFTMDALMNNLITNVIKPCGSYAKDESGASCDAGCVIPKYLDCYKNGGHGSQGVIPFYQSVNQSGELQVSQGLFNATLPTDDINYGFSSPNSKKLLEGSIPLCGSTLIPLFQRKRNRKRKKQWLLVLLLGVFMLCFISGCSDDPAGISLPCGSNGKMTNCSSNDNNCIKNATSGPGCPSAQPPSNQVMTAQDATNALTTARALAGKESVEVPKVATPNLGGADASAAKAAFGGIPRKGLGNGLGAGGGLSGLSTGLKDQGGGAQNLADQNTSNKGGGGGADDANAGNNDGSNGGQIQGNTGADFDSSGKRGGGTGGSSRKIGGFGGGGDSSAQATGAESSALDNYFSQNKDQSLFEIVNTRYQKETPGLTGQ